MDRIDNFESKVCARIFDLLKEQKVTQKEFAKMLGLSPQAISDWKKGINTSFTKYLEPISEALHTTPRWLLSGEGIKYVADEHRTEILQQDSDGAEARIIRTALSYIIDHISDDELHRGMIPPIELLPKIHPDDMYLLEAIMQAMITRRKRPLEKK